MKRIILIILIIPLLWSYAAGQSIDNSPQYIQTMNDPSNTDLKKIQLEFNNYFQDVDKGRGSGFKQFKRWESFAGPRFGPSAKMFNIAAKTLKEYIDYVTNFNTATLPNDYDPGDWTSMGPSSYVLGNGWNGGIGRVNCIAFHPTDNNIYFAGTPAGGLWKRDGPGPWEALTDGLPLIGISGIAISHSNPDVIYILSGDGDGYHTRSIGVLKSVNGGQTWQTTALTFGVLDDKRGYKLLMHPNNAQKMFAVFSDGIYKTEDGWQSFSVVESGWFFDIEFKPNNPAVMYASTDRDFYKSTDGGNNWNITATGLPTTGQYRIAIGVSPDDNAVVYLLYGQDTWEETRTAFKGFYRSYDSGASFNLKSNSPNILGYDANGNDLEGQFSWDLALAVSPTNNHEIHIGGINCWKSTDKGVTWTITSYWKQDVSGYEYTHADIHELVYHHNVVNRLYCGSDGGVFRSLNNADNWTDLSDGLVITQFYRIGTTPQDINKVIGGTQDNGGNTLDNSVFTHDIGADAFESMIDYTDQNILYESTYAYLYKSTNNGTSFYKITPDTVDDDIWDVGWIMHPTDPQTLYLGYTDIWRTTDGGGSWSALSTGNITENFEQIAHGVNNLGRIYGVTINNAYMSNNSGSSWSNITAGLPVAFVNLSYVSVNPANSTVVYVTCSGYKNGDKVYKSTDAGGSWTNISGSLPNIPVNCIVCEDGTNGKVYIGTDVGVYYRDNTIGDWVPFFNGLPNVIVNELEINLTSNKLIAGTYGRGIWKTALYGDNLCPTVHILNNSNNPPASTSQFYQASDHIESTRTIYSSVGASVTYQAGNYVVLEDGFETETDAEFEASLGPCPSSSNNFSSYNINNRISGGFEGQINLNLKSY